MSGKKSEPNIGVALATGLAHEIKTCDGERYIFYGPNIHGQADTSSVGEGCVSAGEQPALVGRQAMLQPALTSEVIETLKHPVAWTIVGGVAILLVIVLAIFCGCKARGNGRARQEAEKEGLMGQAYV